MRYKAMFVAGVAVGFVAGARAGRDAYDKLIGYGRQCAKSPKVQQATSTVQAKAKQAAAKAPEAAKHVASSAASSISTAASSAASSVSAQVPKFASAARHAATDKIPARFGRSHSTAITDQDAAAADGEAEGQPDDVSPDGSPTYPADGSSPSSNGVRYTPDTP